MLLSANRNVTATRLNADAPNEMTVSLPDFLLGTRGTCLNRVTIVWLFFCNKVEEGRWKKEEGRRKREDGRSRRKICLKA